MKNVFKILILLFSISIFGQENEISFLKYEDLEKKIENQEAKLTVVNFWSTTCAPCVKELPEFMEVNEKYKSNPDFKMLLVSLDRPKDIERVKKFIKEKNLTAEVVILDDIKRMNTWIPRFEENWSGEIPARVFFNLIRYRPIQEVRQINIPVLFIAAQRDSLIPIESSREAATNIAPYVQYEEWDMQHFDIYHGEWFKKAIQTQLEFLQQLFGVSK